MKRLFAFLSALAILSACDEPVLLNSFGSISGVVVDSKTVAPLAGVRVSMSPTGTSQVTGQDGTFLFDRLQVQEYTLVATKDGYKSEQQKVSVNPGVTSPAHFTLTPMSGAFSVNPEELDFGNTNTSMKIQVRNLSGTATNYSVTTSNKWLSVSPETGTITQSDYLTVLVSREGLSPGDYSGEITIRYAGETLIVPVKMSVMSSLAAVISLESIYEVGASSAKALAALLSIGASTVSRMGVCWSSTNTVPTISDESSNQGDAYSPCEFNALMTGLSPETTYYCRAYAQNAGGITYSDQCLTFTTTSAESGGEQGGGVSVKQGLMFYMTFDAGTVQDESDNDLETIVMGEPAFLTDTPNGSGKSLFLNGIKGQYISIPYALFDDLSNYSIALWAKDFSAGSFVSGITNLGAGYYSTYNRPKVYITTDGKLFFDTYGRHFDNKDITAFIYPFTNIQSDAWHHIVVTYEIVSFRNASLKLYVDGVFIDTVTDDTCLGSTIKIYIGGDANGKYPVAMTAKMDNIRFYNRTLSKEEVQAIFKSEK